MSKLELGLDTFGDVTFDNHGQLLSQAQVIRNLVEQAKLADEIGLDFFGVGEHHRDDYAVSSPTTVLAGMATVTKNIKLGTAVTVLSSDDPIRVFQSFATVDALSNGRAEVVLGRGSFTESFPLFGYSLRDYDTLFEEKLALFAKVATEEEFSWSGTIRAELKNQQVYPKTDSGKLPVWIGVGGTPQSVIRAAKYGFNLALAIIGGDPAQFAPFAQLYKEAMEQFGHPAGKIGSHSPGYIAETDEQAKEELWPHYLAGFGRVGKERGWSEITRPQFEAMASENGSLFVGSPETVARKIARSAKLLELNRFDLKFSNGPMPHDQLMKSIELYGTKVAPMVQDLLA